MNFNSHVENHDVAGCAVISEHKQEEKKRSGAEFLTRTLPTRVIYTSFFDLFRPLVLLNSERTDFSLFLWQKTSARKIVAPTKHFGILPTTAIATNFPQSS